MGTFFDFKQVLRSYETFQNSIFLDRYINFKNLEDYLKKEIFPVFKHQIIGYSELLRPIYAIDMGKGSEKILIWSQMHGNESTTTKALLDFLNFIRFNQSITSVDNLLKSCKIKIILMLNPDGSASYTRTNANGVDLNRDAVNRSQSETKIFFNCVEEFKPDYCFNMHGQRTIFSAGKTNKPATLSFLAPSFDKDLNINKNRNLAMKLVVSASQMLEDHIPGQIAKYDDAHNPNCFGDQLQKMRIPTVLFEAGHFVADYNRNITRRFIMIGLLKMLESIASSSISQNKIEDYFQIPNNEKLFFDVIIKNAKNSNTGYIGIMYKEALKNKAIQFQPYIKNLDDISTFYAHRKIDALDETVKINGSLTLKIDELIQNISVGGKEVDLKL